MDNGNRPANMLNSTNGWDATGFCHVANSRHASRDNIGKVYDPFRNGRTVGRKQELN